MAFELKVNERVSDGITRNVKNQIEKALRYLGPKAEASGATAPGKDAIGEVRKCFKRVRAALRLVRGELGDDLYHEENWFFRDAARPLTQVRDAVVLVETADRLRQQLVRTIGPGAFTKSPSVVNLHEWRKQTKYVWHQLQLLEATWTDAEKDFVDRAHQLATFLGEDHDLAVLRETLAADPLAYGGHHILKGVFSVIDHHRQEVERQAFALGEEIYKDSPGIFTGRIKVLMYHEEAA